MNKVGGKLKVTSCNYLIRFKRYLNEVDRKPDQQQYDYDHGFKRYLNEVSEKLMPISLHGLKGYLNEAGRKRD